MVECGVDAVEPQTPSPAGRPAGPEVQQRHAILPREGLTYQSVVPTSKGIPLKPLRFSRPGLMETGTARSAPLSLAPRIEEGEGEGVNRR